MITIESTELRYDQTTFTPRLHVQFAVDLTVVREGIDQPEHDLATIIGNEVIRQARMWHAMTRSEETVHEVV